MPAFVADAHDHRRHLAQLPPQSEAKACKPPSVAARVIDGKAHISNSGFWAMVGPMIEHKDRLGSRKIER